MPDLVGGTELILWPHERCASCKHANQADCALIRAIHQYRITAFHGIEILDCEHYQKDISSQAKDPLESFVSANEKIEKLCTALGVAPHAKADNKRDRV